MLKRLCFVAASLLVLTGCPDDEETQDGGLPPVDLGVDGGGVAPDGGDASVQPPDGGDAGLPDAEEPKAIIFLHTNDEHSHHLGFGPEIDDYPMPASSANTEIVGGIRRRAKVLIDLREAAAFDEVPIVTVSAGDIMMGSLFHVANAFAGIDYALLSSGLTYDVLTLGNHEFDFGVGTLNTALRNGSLTLSGMFQQLTIPVVTSNIRFSMTSPADDMLAELYTNTGTGRPLRRYFIGTYSGVRVGFVGVMGIDAALVAPFKSPIKFSLATTNVDCDNDSDCPGSVCLPPAANPTSMMGQCAVPNPENDAGAHFPALVADIAATVLELRSMDVDLVVAISHAGVDEAELSALAMMQMGPENATRSEEIILAKGVDQALAAANVPGIDLIIGGHSHTALLAPLVIPNTRSGINTYVVQAGEYGKYVGKIRLDRATSDDPWVLDTAYSGLVKIDTSIDASMLPGLTGTIINGVLDNVIDGLEGEVISQPDDLIYPGEQCDGMFLPNMGNCSPLVPGATGGTLSCITTMPAGRAGDRQLDLSACTFMHANCGDGAVDGVEMCDGASLNNETCESLGYDSGTLGCHTNCAYDFAACQSYFPSLAEVALNFSLPNYVIKNNPAVSGDLFFYPLGETDFDVPKPEPFHESNLINLATDAARYTLNLLDTQSIADPVRVAINANGVLRDPIQEGETGSLVLSDLFRVLPLGVSPIENTPGYPLVDFYSNAVELKSALEVGVNQGMVADSFWLGISGARIEYDLSLPPFDPANPFTTGRITKIQLVSTDAEAWEDDQLEMTPLYDASLGAFPASYPDPTRLVHVATNLYILLFAEQLGLCPRNVNGSQLDECRGCMGDADCTLAGTTCNETAGRCVGGNPAAFRVRSQSPIGRFGLFQEIKEFLALTTYVRNLPDNNKGGGPDLPDEYNDPVPRRLCCVGTMCTPDRVCN